MENQFSAWPPSETASLKFQSKTYAPGAYQVQSAKSRQVVRETQKETRAPPPHRPPPVTPKMSARCGSGHPRGHSAFTSSERGRSWSCPHTPEWTVIDLNDAAEDGRALRWETLAGTTKATGLLSESVLLKTPHLVLHPALTGLHGRVTRPPARPTRPPHGLGLGRGQGQPEPASPGEVVLLHRGGVGDHALQRLLRAGVTGVPPEVVGRVVFLLIP